MKYITSFSGFSINDLGAAKHFYTEVLGLTAAEEGPGLRIQHVGGGSVIAYVKEDHQPAIYTMFNLVVDDIDAAIANLKQLGVQFERYDDMSQDENGVMRGIADGNGPDIAWFKDPAGNIFAVMQLP